LEGVSMVVQPAKQKSPKTEKGAGLSGHGRNTEKKRKHQVEGTWSNEKGRSNSLPKKAQWERGESMRGGEMHEIRVV